MCSLSSKPNALYKHHPIPKSFCSRYSKNGIKPFSSNYFYWVRHMTLKLRQQELSQRNSAATLESVLLDRVANKDWVTGAIPVWACHTHLLRPPWQCDWASLLRAQQWPQTGKMEQRRRICQKPSLSFENVHAFVGCGAFLSYSLRSDTNPCSASQSTF